MTDHADEPLLLTPGPLTTSRTTKEAMLRDWGSRDGEFIAMNARVRDHLVELAGGAETHTAILLQGAGTFAVEAMIGTLVPRQGKLLILINGAYGRRMAQLSKVIGRTYVTLETPEDTPPDPAAVAAVLAADPAVTHVAMVYCETTSGLLNPLAEVAVVVAAAGRRLLIDAMSAFGALPGDAHSVVLDLHDQWVFMERTGQWRFTPPTHVIAAFDRALAEHAAEGGIAGRGARYRRNCQVLIAGMRAMGFRTLLPDALQAPIIVTFHIPSDPRFAFEEFYDRLRRRGYVIYPGKVTAADTFRIGCIGRLSEADMRGALTAIRGVLDEMGVRVPVAAVAASSL